MPPLSKDYRYVLFDNYFSWHKYILPEEGWQCPACSTSNTHCDKGPLRIHWHMTRILVWCNIPFSAHHLAISHVRVVVPELLITRTKLVHFYLLFHWPYPDGNWVYFVLTFCCWCSQSAHSIGPLSAHQRNAIQMAFRWWTDRGPLIYAITAIYDMQVLHTRAYFCVLWLRPQGGTLIFSYIRRLGSFFLGLKFWTSIFFWGFRKMNIFGGMKIVCTSFGGHGEIGLN